MHRRSSGTNPVLALTSAWHALYTNRPDEMERWIETARSLPHTGPLPDGTCDIPTAIAAVNMLAASDGVLQTAADARTLLDAGTGSGPWRNVAVLLEAVALQVAGKVVDVRPLFEQAEFDTRGMPAAHAVALAHLAVDSMRRGDDRADDEIRRATEEVETNGLTQFRHVSMVYCAKALADARAGRFEISLRTSMHAEAVLNDTVGAARAQIHHRLVLADAAIARNDWATAYRLVREASSQLHLEPDARMLHEWAEPRRATLCTADCEANPTRPHAGGTAGAATARHPLHPGRDRRPPLRVTQHRQDTHRVDLSQARRVRSQ